MRAAEHVENPACHKRTAVLKTTVVNNCISERATPEEIEHSSLNTAQKLLRDMTKAIGEFEVDPHAPTLKDAFGRLQHLQLGVPTSEHGHRLFRVDPTLAECVIKAHIVRKQGDLAAANEAARIELQNADKNVDVSDLL